MKNGCQNPSANSSSVNKYSQHLDDKKQQKNISLKMIQLFIYIGQYKLHLSIPKQIKVEQLLKIVKSYQKLHQEYSPQNSIFIGLASMNNNQVLDYWLTLMQKTLIRFKDKTVLKALYSMESSIQKLTLNSFQFLKCLGKGVSCSVFLARNKITAKLFAIKQIQKRYISDYKKFQQILRQKKILTELADNKHTIKFHCSFESEHHLNFVTDYYPGGELFFHMKGTKLRQQEAQNYFSEILAGIEYLHKNKILYRDLKPENILVDIDGHLRIADFGLSKCGFRQEQYTDSYCGSPQYMAPEMLDKNGYNFSLDFYTLGAILHEFITGLPPFYTTDNQELEYNIQTKQLTFDQIQNKDLKQLLSKLLHKNPSLRLSNFSEIKNSAWLKKINWKYVQQKKLKVPFTLDLYKTYIHDEFLQLIEDVQQLNHLQNDNFQPLFEFFNYIKPQSKNILLGNSQIINTQNAHRKTVVTIKKQNSGKSAKINNKSNISLALFENNNNKDSRDNPILTLIDAKTTKNMNKQNHNNYFIKQKQIKKSPFKTLNNYIGLKQEFNIFPCSTSHKKIQTSKQKDRLKSFKINQSIASSQNVNSIQQLNKHSSSKNLFSRSDKRYIQQNHNNGRQNTSRSKQKRSEIIGKSGNKVFQKSKCQLKKKQRNLSKKQSTAATTNYKIRLA